jgi:hypothetical protein
MGRLAPVPAGEVHVTVEPDVPFTKLAQLNAPIETAVTAQSEVPAGAEITICVPPAAGPEDADTVDDTDGTLQHELVHATQMLEPTLAGL